MPAIGKEIFTHEGVEAKFDGRWKGRAGQVGLEGWSVGSEAPVAEKTGLRKKKIGVRNSFVVVGLLRLKALE